MDRPLRPRRHRRAIARVLAVGALAGTLITPTSPAAAAVTEPGVPGSTSWDVPDGSRNDADALVRNAGPIGIDSALDRDGLLTSITDLAGENGEEPSAPAETVLQVRPEARTTVPDEPAYEFLGEPGTPIWMLPAPEQGSDEAVEHGTPLSPSWAIEVADAEADAGDSSVSWSLLSNAGPGHFALLAGESANAGERMPLFNTVDGIDQDDRFEFDSGIRGHGAWVFTAEGQYCLGFERAVTLADGTAHSERFRLAFAVGEADVMGFDPARCADDDDQGGGDPDPDPDQDPDPDPGPGEPAPGEAWDVANGTINRAGAVVLNNGHVDVASLIEQGSLVTRVKDTTESTANPVWRDPARTVLQLLPEARETVPTGPAWSFLGSPGSTFYQVTQSQQHGLLWPGWSTESIASSATTGGVAWALSAASGPGEFALYETGSFGEPRILFNTRDGIGAADRFTIPKNTHAHGSWAFSAEGNYCLTMQRAAQLADGRTVSDRFTLSIAVGTADVMNVDPRDCGRDGGTDPGVVAPPAPDPGNDATPPAQHVAATQCTMGATILSAGHIDYATRIVGGRLQSLIGDDTSGSKVYREPSGTILWLKPSSRVALPGGFGQVGSAGQPVWQVPQTQNSDLIWLGWNTEALNAGNTRGQVQWTINSIDGPGAMKVYLTGSFGGVQEMVFDNGGSYSIPLGVHAHANWAFTAEGVYRITSTQTATLANGQMSSDTETMTIVVGGTDPASAVGTDLACGPISNTVAVDETEATLVAAAQAGTKEAESAADAVSGRTERDTDERTDPFTAFAQGNPVPILFAVLGGLLVLGAVGTAVLWWQSQAANSGRRAS